MNADELQDLLGMHRTAVLDRCLDRLAEVVEEHAAMIPESHRQEFEDRLNEGASFYPRAEPAPVPDFPEDLFGDEAMKDFVEDQFGKKNKKVSKRG